MQSSTLNPTHDAQAPAAQQAGRNQSIELLRILGSLGIVWFHMALPGAQVTYAALQIFVVLVIYFNADRPLTLAGRRLLIPWAFWSLIFACAKIAQAMVEGRPIADEFDSWMPLTGVGLHLWFLPFSFGILCLNALLGRAMIPLMCLAMAGILWVGEPEAVPIAQWFHVLPAAILGLVMAHFQDNRQAMLIAIPVAVALYSLGLTESSTQFLIGVLVCAVALALQIRDVPGIQSVSQLSFGVYLIHPMLIASLGVIGIESYAPQHFIVVTLGSIIGTLILKRFLPQLV